MCQCRRSRMRTMCISFRHHHQRSDRSLLVVRSCFSSGIRKIGCVWRSNNASSRSFLHGRRALQPMMERKTLKRKTRMNRARAARKHHKGGKKQLKLSRLEPYYRRLHHRCRGRLRQHTILESRYGLTCTFLFHREHFYQWHLLLRSARGRWSHRP